MVERLASLGCAAHFRLARQLESPQLNLGVRRRRRNSKKVVAVHQPSAARHDALRAEPMEQLDSVTRRGRPRLGRRARRIEIATKSFGSSPAGAPARSRRPDPAVLRVDGDPPPNVTLQQTGPSASM